MRGQEPRSCLPSSQSGLFSVTDTETVGYVSARWSACRWVVAVAVAVVAAAVGWRDRGSASSKTMTLGFGEVKQMDGLT